MQLAHDEDNLDEEDAATVSVSHQLTTVSEDRSTTREVAKLARFEDTWNVCDYLVEQERVYDRRAREQFDLFVRRRRQCDFVLNAVFHDTCSANSFTSEREKLRHL